MSERLNVLFLFYWNIRCKSNWARGNICLVLVWSKLNCNIVTLKCLKQKVAEKEHQNKKTSIIIKQNEKNIQSKENLTCIVLTDHLFIAHLNQSQANRHHYLLIFVSYTHEKKTIGKSIEKIYDFIIELKVLNVEQMVLTMYWIGCTPIIIRTSIIFKYETEETK